MFNMNNFSNGSDSRGASMRMLLLNISYSRQSNMPKSVAVETLERIV